MENENLSEEKTEELSADAADLTDKTKTPSDQEFDAEISDENIDRKESPKKKGQTKKKKALSSAENDESDDAIDAPSIDSLLYDGDDGVILPDTEDAHTNFEEFLADYKSKIAKTLAMAKGASAKSQNDTPPSDESVEKDSDGSVELTEEKEKIHEEQNEAFYNELISDEEAPQFTIDISEQKEVSNEEVDDEKERGYDPEKPRIIDSIFDFAELFIFTLAAVLILTTFFFKHTIVEGGSMNNTLYDGEHLIVSDLFYTPERGDIIVFADYSEGQKAPFVKRVIGIAGDTVTVDTVGNVTVNGEPLEEEYVLVDGNFPAGYLGKEYTVKEGEVFVLGDHRNASYDSASFPYTAVKIESILGKVLFRIYPFESFGIVE